MIGGVQRLTAKEGLMDGMTLFYSMMGGILLSVFYVPPPGGWRRRK